MLNACKRILDIHASRKQTYAIPFINKALSKETMTRSRLRNKFLKDKSEERSIQTAQFIVHHFWENLYRTILLSFKCIVVIDIFHEKNINDKNTFWKAIQPFLSDKVRSTSKMTLIDKENNIVDEYNTAKVMSTFFSYIVSNLNIAECSNCEPVANNISDPLLKCVVTYRNHPSILAIGLPFSFSKINREEILWKS